MLTNLDLLGTVVGLTAGVAVGIVLLGWFLMPRIVGTYRATLHDLDDRTQALERRLEGALGKVERLEGELRSAYGHLDAIYGALEAFEAGRAWAAGFRRDDPRTRRLYAAPNNGGDPGAGAPRS